MRTIRFAVRASSMLFRVTAIFVAGAANAQERPLVTPDRCTESFPNAVLAINDWAKANQIEISPSVRRSIMSSYCRAANEVSTQKGGLTISQVDAKSEPAIFDQLNREIDPGGTSQAMAASLGSQFGIPGFARPKMKAYGVVDVTYKNRVDSFWLNGEALDPAPAFLVTLGNVTYKGLNGLTELCSGQITVKYSVHGAVSC